jgi:hypothetical protein
VKQISKASVGGFKAVREFEVEIGRFNATA